MSPAKQSKTMGAELRARAEAFQEARADPVALARRHEKSMLDSFVTATRSLEWLAVNEGWKLLGFETCAEWWTARVQPVVEALGLTPSPEMARRLIAVIQEQEQALPAAQRRTPKQLAAMVGRKSDWVARSSQDREVRGDHVNDDLDGSTTADSFACERCGETLAAGIVRAAQTRCLDCDPLRLHGAVERGGPCLLCGTTNRASLLGVLGEEYCEWCACPLPSPMVQAGQRRCTTCDPSSLHRREVGPDGDWGRCGECARIARTAVGVDTAPVEVGDAADVAPAAGSEPVATGLGSGKKTAAGRGHDTPPADGAAPTGRVVHGPATPAPGGGEEEAPLSGVTPSSPAAVDRLGSSHGTPGASPAPLPQAQPGPDEDPDEAVLAAIENYTEAVAPSSNGPWPYVIRPSFAGGDVADVLWLFREIERSLDEVDVDVLGPLLTDAEMALLHDSAEQVARIVGLIEKCRTP